MLVSGVIRRNHRSRLESNKCTRFDLLMLYKKSQKVCRGKPNAANASVLGIFAKGVNACDRVSCSTKMLYREANML